MDISLRLSFQNKDYLIMAIPISEPEIEAAQAELEATHGGINNLHNSSNNSYRARRIAARNRARLRAQQNIPSLNSFETVDSNNNTIYTYPNLQNLQVQEPSTVSPIIRGNNTFSNQPETYHHHHHHEMSFLQQLLHEIWNVWQPFSSRRSSPTTTSTTSHNATDNQTLPPPSPSSTNLNSFSSYLPSLPLPLPLPDLIQCSVDLVVDASVNTSPSSLDEDSFDEGAEEEPIDEVDSDWSLDFELKVSAALKWRQTGRDLRRIADQFTLENAHRSRRRMSSSSSSSPNNSRFEFRMALKVAALPAIALVGLGIKLFRRN